MAAVLGGLFRLNAGLINNPFLRKSLLNGKLRFLYTDSALGLTGYESARLSYRNQFINIESTFRTKMNEVCEDQHGMVFTEDLKAMLHLLQKRDDDMKLIENMIQKFSSQSEQFRFGNFVFGPVVMRAFYYLGTPDIALKLFKTPELEKFFSQNMSYHILMSLLYKHERYADIREVYDILRNKFFDSATYPTHPVILVMAACYKENTRQSYDYALSIWKELSERDRLIPRRAIAFVALTAINQGAAPIAIEMLSNVRNKRNADIRSLRVSAYTKLQKFTEIIPILRMSLESESQGGRKETYFYDVIEELSTVLKDSNEHDELLHVIMQIKNNGHISNETLESFLCRPMNLTRRPLRTDGTSFEGQSSRDMNFRQGATSTI